MTEGHSKEEPQAHEMGEPGTPGAGMTPEVPHAADADLVEHGDAPADPLVDTAHHDPVTHMDSQTVLSDDDHGHAEMTLGPIDWASWTYALVGSAAGIAVLLFFWIAVN